jgi:hypothetical protein
MTFKQKLVGVIVAVLALLGVGPQLYSGIGNSAQKFSTIGETGTSGPMYLAANTSTQMVASSSAREVARISNLGTNPIYCSANGDKAAVAYSGITVYGSSTLSFDEQFPYTGAVRCIAPFGAASTTVYARQ